MPIYEYVCHSCGRQFEIMQKISDEPLSNCPTCHANEVTKLVSAPSFQLKGTGWYVTDFKDKKSTNEAAKPASSSPENKTTTETKTEIKTDAANKQATTTKSDKPT